MTEFSLWRDSKLEQALIRKHALARAKDYDTEVLTENGYFVYHLDQLAQHLAMLQQQNTIKLWYAVKANPLSRIIQTLDQQQFNFDVASYGELEQVLKQGIDAKRILNTGPAKSKRQLKAFLQQGVNTFVIESLNQLTWLNEAASELQCKPTVLLRVQLQWQNDEKNPLGGNTVTPFGLSTSLWEGIQLSDYSALDICGLHIFQWGNMLCHKKMYSLWSTMIEPLLTLAEKLAMPLKILDLGGGLGLDYDAQQSALNWSQVVADLADIKQQAKVDELWLELGRYAVGQCGYYVTEVIDRKTNYQQEQLVLAGGINHLLRPAITGQAFPVALLNTQLSDNESGNFHLHGPLCTSLDKLGCLTLPANTKVGDKLIFGFCGAYGFTESMPFFLCHQLAAEYVFQNNQLTQVRQSQPASSYLR